MLKSRPGYPIFKMLIKYEPDIVTARQKTRNISQLFGFGGQDRARLSTAVSELARNVFQYAQTGAIEFFYSDQNPPTFFVRVSDRGPGIKDLESILEGTYISKSGMGVGLVGSKRLMDTFEIETSPEGGTTILLGKFLDRRSHAISKKDLPEIVVQLSSKGADSAFEEIQNQNRDLLEALDDARLARHELTALNSKLKIAHDAADRASQAKSRFLANMSHEIRTPLGIILGYADLALDPTSNSGERADYLMTIKRNAKNLTNLIGEILDLAKVEAGRIEIEKIEFSLPSLMADLVSSLDLHAREKGVGLKLVIDGSFPDIVVSDPTRVRQVLLNLINNALKFTNQGEIKIQANATSTVAGEAHSNIEITVHDTGIGIPQAEQGKLFEAFVQADSSTTRKFGGTGLGLNLSRHLAQALGGNLFLLSSDENLGSKFCFTFKVELSPNTLFRDRLEQSVANQEVESEPLFTDELHNMKILLVEDSPDNQFLFVHYLSKVGARVEVAEDGLEGVEKGVLPGFDAILMDMQMPKLDGYGATKKLRELGVTIPIIALTAHALKEERDRALMNGFSGYLIKPLNPKYLIESLRPFKRSPVV